MIAQKHFIHSNDRYFQYWWKNIQKAEVNSLIIEPESEYIGAAKILDGLFIGDAICAEVSKRSANNWIFSSFSMLISAFKIINCSLWLFKNIKDLEFLKSNKISRIVNCAGDQVENTQEKHGFIYLTFNWEEFKVKIWVSFYFSLASWPEWNSCEGVAIFYNPCPR